MQNFDKFFAQTLSQLSVTKKSQTDNIHKAAEMFAACMNNQGIIQLVGVDHGRALAMELGYRAGGLMPFHQFDARDLAMRGILTQAEIVPSVFNATAENAQKWLDLYNIDPRDYFLINSFKGTETVLVELAKTVKKNGHTLIVVISKKAEEAETTKHPGIEKISDYADLVIDTCVDANDTVVEVDGKHRAGQLNTICGNVIAQMITAETYRYLKNHDDACPVLLSANVKGADVHNRAISDPYVGRWNS